MDAKGVTKIPRRQLVQAAAAKLRDVILAREPGTQIGSLNEVAELLGVGIVTVQQAARVLEHEGLLAVRRGPGGGYYGTRPDEAALERAFAAYLRVHGFSNRESHRAHERRSRTARCGESCHHQYRSGCRRRPRAQPSPIEGAWPVREKPRRTLPAPPSSWLARRSTSTSSGAYRRSPDSR